MRDALAAIFTPERVKTAPADLKFWGTDWTRGFNVAALAIGFPERVEEVVAITRLANERGFGLVPSGGRTGLSGGAVATNGEVVVSFDRMNRILGFDAADRVARCQAGVPTQALQEYAAARGCFYPVDFASVGSSQIGGNVATNAGGVKVIRYGLTRDWVVGLKVVTGAGDVLDCNNGLVKNATGYDLRHLFIGAEGTLGFVVEAQVRLLATPPEQRVMVLGIEHAEDLLRVLERFQASVTLSAFEFFSEVALQKVLAHRGGQRPFANATPFYALIEFDAAQEAAALGAFKTALDAGCATEGVLSQSEGQAQALWALRDGISESIAGFTPYKNDLAVRVSAMPAFLKEIDHIIGTSYPAFEVCWFGHIGDGNLHLNILKPEGVSLAAFQTQCKDLSPRLFEAVQRHQGSISAEHGVGLTKRDFLGFSRSAREIELMRAMKRVFDPRGVMNPGKLLAG